MVWAARAGILGEQDRVVHLTRPEGRGDVRQRQEDRNKTHAQWQIERLRAEWKEQQRLLDQLMEVERTRTGGARGGRTSELRRRKKVAERHAMESILRIQNVEEERRARDQMRKLEEVNRNLVNLKMRETGLDEITAKWEVRYEQWLKRRQTVTSSADCVLFFLDLALKPEPRDRATGGH